MARYEEDDYPEAVEAPYEPYDEYGYGDGESGGAYEIPEVVKQFLEYFQRKIEEGAVYEILSLYENSFNTLTEKFFKNSPWPRPAAVAEIVGGDQVFLMLYKEIYYRHIYSKLQPTLQHRFESFETYKELFGYILDSSTPVALELPNAWLWDVIDEYIYQFQAFSQYRQKLKSLSDEEKTALKEHPEAWSVQSVLSTLYSLVNKSNIEALLQRERADPERAVSAREPGFEFGAYNIYKMLGYFSIIGLLRVHCLMGDYYLALKTLEPIDIGQQRAYYAETTACYITTFYYLGFAYMMMRRYVDAIKTWSNVLLYISRTKQFHTRSYQYDQILKKVEQMYYLLAIALSLCPTRVDENVHQMLRDKHGERMLRMQRCDEATFEEAFQYACPKFITPSIPDFDEEPARNYNQDAYRLQLNLFMQEIRQQSLLPTIRSYLKLYTTMGTPKLADFLDMDESEFRTLLLCYKHKTRNPVWTGSGPPLTGPVQSSSDVEFYVDGEMVHIADTKVARRYGEYFMRHIKKFDEINRDTSRAAT